MSLDRSCTVNDILRGQLNFYFFPLSQIPLRFLIGSLYVNLSLLWEPIKHLIMCVMWSPHDCHMTKIVFQILCRWWKEETVLGDLWPFSWKIFKHFGSSDHHCATLRESQLARFHSSAVPVPVRFGVWYGMGTTGPRQLQATLVGHSLRYSVFCRASFPNLGSSVFAVHWVRVTHVLY